VSLQTLCGIVAVVLCACNAPAAPAEAARFFESSGGVRLAYTLDLPAGSGPFPAVVIGHGSGRVTRDQLTWFSARFNAAGFATLRFDKRGVGESTGQYSEVPAHTSLTLIPILAGDIAAGVRFLQRRTEIDASRVGLAGVSQAGWILPHAARELGGVAFMVFWSGPVCTVGLENYYSALADGTTLPLDEVYARLPSFGGPQGYDPVQPLEQVETPSLWLFGAEDRSIPVRTSVANLTRLAASGKPFEWRVYEGLGHNLSQAIWPDALQWMQRFR
jgi:uncharacterized protein